MPPSLGQVPPLTHGVPSFLCRIPPTYSCPPSRRSCEIWRIVTTRQVTATAAARRDVLHVFTPGGGKPSTHGAVYSTYPTVPRVQTPLASLYPACTPVFVPPFSHGLDIRTRTKKGPISLVLQVRALLETMLQFLCWLYKQVNTGDLGQFSVSQPKGLCIR